MGTSDTAKDILNLHTLLRNLRKDILAAFKRFRTEKSAATNDSDAWRDTGDHEGFESMSACDLLRKPKKKRKRLSAAEMREKEGDEAISRNVPQNSPLIQAFSDCWEWQFHNQIHELRPHGGVRKGGPARMGIVEISLSHFTKLFKQVACMLLLLATILTEGQACWVRYRWYEQRNLPCIVAVSQSHNCYNCWIEANVLCGELIASCDEDGWIQHQLNTRMYFTDNPGFGHDADDEEGDFMRTKRGDG